MSNQSKNENAEKTTKTVSIKVSIEHFEKLKKICKGRGYGYTTARFLRDSIDFWSSEL